MSGSNGHGNGSDGPIMERLVGLISRLNEWVRRVDDKLDRLLERSALSQQSSERVEREQREQAQRLTRLEGGVDETREEIGEFREETNPRMRVQKDESAVALAGKLAAKVPGPVWMAAAKIGVSLAIGVGIGLAWAWRLITHGH